MPLGMSRVPVLKSKILTPASAGKWQTTLVVGCLLLGLFVLRHLSASSFKIVHLADALRACLNKPAPEVQVVEVNPDPFASSTVYMPVPCDASVSSSSDDTSVAALTQEIRELKKLIARKEEVLRARSNQLVEVNKKIEDRQGLWNASSLRLASALQNVSTSEPDLMAVVAVVSDYGALDLRQRLRKAWYPNGDPKPLEECLGVRMVFVIGENPTQISDGSGVTSDTTAVIQEVAANSDILRVPATHIDGTDGRAKLVHELWKRLPLQHNAKFYVKAQAHALPNPRGVVEALQQYESEHAAYVGCMKAGPVVTDWKSPWYEAAAWKFGGSGTSGNERYYMLHASANGYALSRSVALHVGLFGDVLAEYSNEDVMVGSWMLGLNVEHHYDAAFCCSDLAFCSANAAAIASALPADPDSLLDDTTAITGTNANLDTTGIGGAGGGVENQDGKQTFDCGLFGSIPEPETQAGSGSLNAPPSHRRHSPIRRRRSSPDITIPTQRVCASFSGSCNNGVCNVEDSKSADWAKYLECPRVI